MLQSAENITRATDYREMLELKDVFESDSRATLVLESDQIIFCNNAAKSLIGACVKGQTIDDIVASPKTKIDKLLQQAARTRSPVPGVLIFQQIDPKLAKPLRCDAALLRQSAGGSQALVVLRLRDAQKSSKRFASLTQRNKQLTEELARGRQTRAQLRCAVKNFRNIFESSPIGIAVVQSCGKVVIANDTLCEMLGFSERDLLSKNFDSIIRTEQTSDNYLTLDEIATSNQKIQRAEFYVNVRRVIQFGFVKP